jgi:hypothetical protein
LNNITQQARGVNMQIPLQTSSNSLQTAPADPVNRIQGNKTTRSQGAQSKTHVNQEQNDSPRSLLIQEENVSQSAPGQGPKKENPTAISSISTPRADTPGSAAQPGNAEANCQARAQDKSPDILGSQGYSRAQWQKDSMLIREILRAPESSVLREFVELLDDIDHTRLEGAEVYLTDNSFNRDLVAKAKQTIESHQWPMRHLEEFTSFLNRWRGGWCASRTVRKSLGATPVNETPSPQKAISGKPEPSPSVSQRSTTSNILRIIEVDTQKEWQSWLDELSTLKARVAEENASLTPRKEDNTSKSVDLVKMSSLATDLIAMIRKWGMPESNRYYKGEDEDVEISQVELMIKRREKILNTRQGDYKAIFHQVHTKLPMQIHDLEDKIRKYRDELENMLETHPRLRVAFSDVLEKLAGV